MSEQWYFMAFGIELGPMSKDDLAERVARGDVLPDSKVREGATGAWVAARTAPGLFPAAGSAAESGWYYEFMGELLGPMQLGDLRLLAEQGSLKPDSRVREGARGEWQPAASMPELFPAPSSAPSAGDAEFEVSPPHWGSRPVPAKAAPPKTGPAKAAPQSSPVPPAAPAPPGGNDADDADFDLGPPADG